MPLYIHSIYLFLYIMEGEICLLIIITGNKFIHEDNIS